MALLNQPVQPTRDQLILSGVNLQEGWKPFLNDRHVKVKV